MRTTRKRWKEELADLARKLEPVSINGRVAFGITCLETMCRHWQISGASVQALLDKLWEFTQSDRLDLWEEELLEYCPGSPVPDEEDADRFGLHHLPYEKQKAFCEMVYKVFEIGTANLYGGFRSEFSMKPALKAAERMLEHGLPLPDTRPFARSKVTERHGWGERVNRTFFRGK